MKRRTTIGGSRPIARRQGIPKRYALRIRVTANPDAYRFPVTEAQRVEVRMYRRLSEAIAAARAVHAARPFGLHAETLVYGAFGEDSGPGIEVSQNGRIWGPEKRDGFGRVDGIRVEYELQDETLIERKEVR